MKKRNDLEINNILDLQLALIENNNSAIRGYVERLDRETSNEAMRQAGEHFGFPTVEVNGVFYAANRHISAVFGHKDVNGLLKLLKRRGISGVNMPGYGHDVRCQIRETLNLSSQDRKTILHDWPAFLIGGMNSTTNEAKVVQAYLLRMERIARIGIIGIKRGQMMDNLPEAAHAIVKAKLAREAWRGNPIAAYILENDYLIPVSQLLQKTDPEMSEIAGTITQYLSFICEDNLTAYGLKIGKTSSGYFVEGKAEEFYVSFLEVARRHRLKRFFGNKLNLGNLLSRESDAIETLGWRRSLARMIRGMRIYRYEQRASIEERHPATGTSDN